MPPSRLSVHSVFEKQPSQNRDYLQNREETSRHYTPIPSMRDPSTTTLPLHRPLSHHLHIQCGRSRDLSTPVQLQNQRVVQVGKYHPSKYQTHFPSRYPDRPIFSVTNAARSSSSHRLPPDNYTSDSARQRRDEVTKAGQPGVVVYSEPAITQLKSNMLLKD